MLPKKINKDESCVINIQNYFDGNGSHWVSIFNDENHDDVQYFDSFGLKPSDVVLDYMKTANKGIVYNSSQIQHIDSILCGYYCIYFIIERNRGRSMRDVLLDFRQNPSIVNEWMISKFAKTV